MAFEPSRFHAVLFDLDGTLVDSVEDIAASVNHVRTLMGMDPLPSELVGSYVGDGVYALFERVLQTQDRSVLDQAIALWRPYYLAHCLERTQLYPGIFELLHGLRARGMPIGVVSNKPAAPTEIILKGLGILSFFQAVVGGDTTPKRKPDPEPLQFAADRMGVRNGVLMVGDSPNDVLGARRAGYASCGVLWGIGKREHLEACEPHHLAQTPAELHQWFMNARSENRDSPIRVSLFRR